MHTRMRREENRKIVISLKQLIDLQEKEIMAKELSWLTLALFVCRLGGASHLFTLLSSLLKDSFLCSLQTWIVIASSMLLSTNGTCVKRPTPEEKYYQTRSTCLACQKSEKLESNFKSNDWPCCRVWQWQNCCRQQRRLEIREVSKAHGRCESQRDLKMLIPNENCKFGCATLESTLDVSTDCF